MTPLTQRQLEILGLLASGYTQIEIAGIVFLTRQSVRNALSHAREAGNAKSVTHLAVMALDRGWLVRDGDSYKPAAPQQSAA